ncbi:hypothetical protein KC19_4G214400 [Ceratodon purpureus]|uniref:Uncharacterized protein n=1 Tax=Ceratodon purpureus TaxID=3225 RepID=A0A8T0IDP4_CERPU|nr:hypothetical protein KC19_4G214400 [Ceratodon purpureus]KAG0580972.1 hypothetical protein KC19_4G214400 [Ceratodon purpureus]
MDRDHIPIMEALSFGQHCKITRVDITTGIFDCPKLLYASDGEEDDNLPNAHENDNLPNAHEDDNLPNVQGENPEHEVVGPLGIVEPFQSLEQIFNTQFHEQSVDRVRSLMAQSDEGNPLLKEEVVDLPEKLSNVEWIEYLVKKGPTILTSPKNRMQTSTILRKLSGELMVLPPGNNAEVQGDWRDRSQWWRYLSALVSELMMVEDGCSSEVRDAGLFVLSTFEYPALLELMAQEIAQTLVA